MSGGINPPLCFILKGDKIPTDIYDSAYNSLINRRSVCYLDDKCIRLGRILLVIADENAALISIPRINWEAGILLPDSSRMRVSFPMTRRMASLFLSQLKQLE